MGHIRGMDRTQQVLLPETIDDYVGPENPVRFLDAFVDKLDLGRMGFKRAVAARTGAPGYHPGTLLKLYVYGYLYQIRSSRRLEREAKRNLELIWLLGKLQPDFKTIADFRRDHPDQVRAVCSEFTVFCKKLELFGRELVGIDGSKFLALNSLSRNHTQTTLRRGLEQIDHRIDGYMAALEEGDRTEASTEGPSAEELKEKIKQLEAMRRRYEELQERLRTQGEKQISETDAESRRMKLKGRFEVCYNVQIAVDSKHHLIVAHEVTNAVNDQAQLSVMAEAAKEALEVETLEVVADGGYNTEAEVARCEEAGIVVYLPRPKPKGTLYPRSSFTYLPQEDAYRCPAGSLLTYRHTEKNGEEPFRCYQTYACAGCPLRSECTQDKSGRRIRRSSLEWASERMYRRTAEKPEVLRLRKTLVEHPFGTMKRGKGEGHFLLRGLRKVRGEFSLSVLAYNLQRVLKLRSVSELLAALDAGSAPPTRPRSGSGPAWGARLALRGA